MNWQDIMNQVLEINELQQEISIKVNSQTIQKIINRKNKYIDIEDFDLRSLNNAVLEHQVIITPYQISIIEKINELSLNLDIQSIYINMPENLEDALEYVINLKKQYQLANNCFDLIENIEKISAIEYIDTKSFDNTVYAKKIEHENQIYINLALNHNSINTSILKEIIKTKLKEFNNSLSIDEKKSLLIEILSLSYEKNAFDFFNSIKIRNELYHKRNYDLVSIITSYSKYKKIITNLEIQKYLNMSLDEIYNCFKLIYETDFFKQKVNKK